MAIVKNDFMVSNQNHSEWRFSINTIRTIKSQRLGLNLSLSITGSVSVTLSSPGNVREYALAYALRSMTFDLLNLSAVYDMSMAAMSLKSRFRGAMVGALIGDCLGAYWETQSWKGTHPIEAVKEKIEEQIRQTTSGKAPVISYTDDTALTFAMADSLVKCSRFDARHMAKR